jgi:hypothetical protein
MNQIQKYLSGIYRVFYDKNFYHDVIAKWNVYGIGYLFLLCALFSISISNYNYKIIREFFSYDISSEFDNSGNVSFNENTDELIKSFPKITYKSGKFYSEEKEPKLILDNSLQPFFLIDLEDKKIENEYDKIIHIGSSKVTVKSGESLFTIGAKDFIGMFSKESKPKEFTFTQEHIKAVFFYIGFLSSVNILIVYLLSLLSLMAVYIFNSLIFTLFAKSMGFMMAIDLKYKTAFRIAVVTSTPLIIFDAITFSTGFEVFKMKDLIYFLMHLVYVFFALESFKKIALSQNR